MRTAEAGEVTVSFLAFVLMAAIGLVPFNVMDVLNIIVLIFFIGLLTVAVSVVSGYSLLPTLGVVVGLFTLVSLGLIGIAYFLRMRDR